MKRLLGGSLSRGKGVLAAAGAALLTGCVYLRLLEVKNQLKDFDRHFAIGGRADLVIEFLKPVLTSRDARFLIGSDPLVTRDSPGPQYHYEFEMVQESTGPQPPMARLTLDLGFDKGRLNRLIVPEKFMLLFPRNVLVETLKQARNAEVFPSRRLARGVVVLSPEVEDELPSLEKTRFLLGIPLTEGPVDDGLRLAFRYHILGAPRDVPIWARLTFDGEGLLRETSVRWDTSTVTAVFERR